MTSLHQIPDEVHLHEQERHAQEGAVSRWSSKKTRFIVDRPPSQPLSRRRRAVGSRQEGCSRWSSGSKAAFDTASPYVVARHRMITRPSTCTSVSALKHSATMKNHDVFETTIRTGGTGTLDCSALLEVRSCSCTSYAIRTILIHAKSC
jgi:hypothetical protein